MRYSCASFHVDITPIAPCALAGYGHRKGTWRHVESRLEANAILISDGDTRLLFVAADILYFGKELTTILESHAGELGLPRDCLVLSASHTHFAPVTERSKPSLGMYDATYNDFLKNRLKGLITTVMSSPVQPVQAHTSRTITEANVNRRRRWPLPIVTRHGLKLPPNIVMAAAPSKPVDRFIDTLQFLDQDGKVVCVAWKFTCHPVGLPDIDQVSAEFPGRARNHIRQSLGENIPVLFWQGFAGDVRPRLSGKKSLKDHVLSSCRGPSFGRISKDDWVAWCDRLSDRLLAAIRKPETQPLTGKLRAVSVDVRLPLLMDENPGCPAVDPAMRIQKISIGDTCCLFFFGAEVCSPYLQYLQAGPGRICVGYTGDVFGYLPSAAQAQEGGYEGTGFLKIFGLAGPLRAGFEANVLAAVRCLESAPPV